MTCALCENPVLAKSLCKKHYTRLRNHGSPDVVLCPRGEAQKFIADVEPSNSCISWPFKSVYTNGYGAVFFRGKLTGAHRAVCHIHNGEPPSAKHHAAHTCGNRICVNPAHIRWSTASENEADKAKHGTAPVGERNGTAKLTEIEVTQIRSIGKTKTQHEIAGMFGVSRRAIGMILSGKTWAHVTDLKARYQA